MAQNESEDVAELSLEPATTGPNAEIDQPLLPDDAHEDALLSRIPFMVGDSKKADYLSYRATGFSVSVACQLAEVERTTVNKWRKTDKAFKSFEETRLEELQKSTSADVLRLEFLRNMRMIMKKDFEVIGQALFEQSEMTDREWAYFKQIRRHYTPNDMLALEKTLSPENHRDTLEITLSWGSTDDSVTVDGDFTEVAEQPPMQIEATDSSGNS